MTMIPPPGRWWYLDLAAEFPELEIYNGHGWGPVQELGLLELGERVMEHETYWLFTWIYSKEKDRIWAAVGGMFRMVLQAMRENGQDYPITESSVPDGWYPDVKGWDEGTRP